MKGLADQFVDTTGSVGLRGVDVIDTGVHRGAQDSSGLVTVPGRAEDAVSGQLHRGIVKLFGNACGAVDVSELAGKRWWLTASFKPLRR